MAEESEPTPPQDTGAFLGYSKIIGFSSVTGFCVGAAFKRVGSEVAFILGTAFITLQALNYGGYVDVHWLKLKQDFETKLDADGDKKLTTNDLNIWLKKLVPYGVNFAGFVAGLLAALQYL